MFELLKMENNKGYLQAKEYSSFQFILTSKMSLKEYIFL
jgi:hypothetical protein